MDGGYTEYSIGVEMWMEATHRCGDVDVGNTP